VLGLKGGRRRLAYGVVGSELEGFVSGDPFVSEYLARFKKSPRTRWAYASTLFMFFRWLQLVHGLVLDGRQLLDKHIGYRGSVKVQNRRWGLRLALGFSRDNPDLSECSDGRKYQMFNVVKQFFDYHEAPLTSAKKVYNQKIRRKFHPKQISVDDARRLLGYFNTRDRAILLVMLQSGMSIGDVLNKFSLMLPQLSGALQAGTSRFRVDFDERKGNGFNYFTFISADALHELRKWLSLREHWLDGRGDPGCIFIAKPIATRGGRPCLVGRALSVVSFEVNFNRVVRKMKLKDEAWGVTPHMFRKLFKTESRAPERGVDQDCVEFLMGHSSGIQAVGGIYDRTPELHAEVVEKEYQKMEPYLNIYSQRPGETEEEEDLSQEDFDTLMEMIQEFKKRKTKVAP
jgi:integrase